MKLLPLPGPGESLLQELCPALQSAVPASSWGQLGTALGLLTALELMALTHWH